MNPNMIPWTHCQDVQIPDRLLQKKFNDFIANAQYIEAIQLLENNDLALKGKAFVSEIIKKIVYGIVWLEEQFDNNVNVFLSDLAQKHKEMIDSVIYMREWNSGVQYRPYNFVVYQNEIYMATSIPPLGTLPDDKRFWLKLGLRGFNGQPGIDVNIRFEWLNSRQYRHRDIVAYGDNLYYALKDNKGVIPGTDETTWLTFILVSQGGITVGVNPPELPTNNSVWFKTETDPLATDQPTSGEFLRYRVQYAEWEVMYPATLFTLIKGVEQYTLKAISRKFDIQVRDWGKLGEQYIFTIQNDAITDARFVEILYGDFLTQTQFRLFSSLKVEVQGNEVSLKTTKKPTVNLPVLIKIQ